jgi:hypothetical protein
MLKLEDYKTIFIVVSLVGALVIAAPTLASILPTRATERFSELYVLGPNRVAEGYASNVKAGETYKVYVGVGNHMGSSAYYALHVKLRNRGEPLPNSTTSTPSALPALYEYRVFLGDGGDWETPLDFSFRGLSFYGNSCTVETLSTNGLNLHVGKVASWDSESKGYYLELFFELWIFIPESRSFSYHNRFVGLWLNMTA